MQLCSNSPQASGQVAQNVSAFLGLDQLAQIVHLYWLPEVLALVKCTHKYLEDQEVDYATYKESDEQRFTYHVYSISQNRLLRQLSHSFDAFEPRKNLQPSVFQRFGFHNQSQKLYGFNSFCVKRFDLEDASRDLVLLDGIDPSQDVQCYEWQAYLIFQMAASNVHLVIDTAKDKAELRVDSSDLDYFDSYTGRGYLASSSPSPSYGQAKNWIADNGEDCDKRLPKHSFHRLLGCPDGSPYLIALCDGVLYRVWSRSHLYLMMDDIFSSPRWNEDLSSSAVDSLLKPLRYKGCGVLPSRRGVWVLGLRLNKDRDRDEAVIVDVEKQEHRAHKISGLRLHCWIDLTAVFRPLSTTTDGVDLGLVVLVYRQGAVDVWSLTHKQYVHRLDAMPSAHKKLSYFQLLPLSDLRSDHSSESINWFD